LLGFLALVNDKTPSTTSCHIAPGFYGYPFVRSRTKACQQCTGIIADIGLR
jgi:hypothetical protein